MSNVRMSSLAETADKMSALAGVASIARMSSLAATADKMSALAGVASIARMSSLAATADKMSALAGVASMARIPDLPSLGVMTGSLYGHELYGSFGSFAKDQSERVISHSPGRSHDVPLDNPDPEYLALSQALVAIAYLSFISMAWLLWSSPPGREWLDRTQPLITLLLAATSLAIAIGRPR